MASNKKLLLPTDFSNNAWKALEFAARLQEHTQMEIVILHAFLPFYTGFQSASENKAQYETGYRISSQRMESLEEKIKAELPQLKYETVIKDGTLYNTIEEVQEEKHIHAIIMGTKGASGIQANLIGSQTFEVGKRANISMVIIPEQYEYQDNAEAVFLTNLEKTDIQAIESVKSTIQPQKIHFVHFANAIPSPSLEAEIKEHISHLDLTGIEVSTEIMDIGIFNSPEKIKKTIAEKQWSLISLNPGQKGFFENLFSKSFSKPLVHSSTVPIFLAKTF